MIKQTKITYSSLGKAFEKQSKAMKDQGDKMNTDLNMKMKMMNNDKDQYIKMLIRYGIGLMHVDFFCCQMVLDLIKM